MFWAQREGDCSRVTASSPAAIPRFLFVLTVNSLPVCVQQVLLWAMSWECLLGTGPPGLPSRASLGSAGPKPFKRRDPGWAPGQEAGCLSRVQRKTS